MCPWLERFAPSGSSQKGPSVGAVGLWSPPLEWHNCNVQILAAREGEVSLSTEGAICPWLERHTSRGGGSQRVPEAAYCYGGLVVPAYWSSATSVSKSWQLGWRKP